jgi:hypothetical protein
LATGTTPSVSLREDSRRASSREVRLAQDSIHDRLARLTFLCSQAHAADRRKKIPTDRLEEVLAEAVQLCRVLRKALKKNAEK